MPTYLKVVKLPYPFSFLNLKEYKDSLLNSQKFWLIILLINSLSQVVNRITKKKKKLR